MFRPFSGPSSGHKRYKEEKRFICVNFINRLKTFFGPFLGHLQVTKCVRRRTYTTLYSFSSYILWPEDSPAKVPKPVVSLIIKLTYINSFSSSYILWPEDIPAKGPKPVVSLIIKLTYINSFSSLYNLWPEDGPAKGTKHVVSLIIKLTYIKSCVVTH
jgi:hypothetical protein